jgi:hypothetical protein
MIRLPKQPIMLTPGQKEILAELKAEGIPARISTTGWLLVSGMRTYWQEAYWMAFLGWKKGMNPPKIMRTL